MVITTYEYKHETLYRNRHGLQSGCTVKQWIWIRPRLEKVRFLEHVLMQCINHNTFRMNTFLWLFRTSEVDAMRIYKPWMYPQFIFNIYTKLTGLDKIYKIFQSKPSQVSIFFTAHFFHSWMQPCIVYRSLRQVRRLQYDHLLDRNSGPKVSYNL